MTARVMFGWFAAAGWLGVLVTTAAGARLLLAVLTLVWVLSFLEDRVDLSWVDRCLGGAR